MKEQKYCSELLHEEIDGWVRDAVKNSDKPFFAYYASPWPHAPVAAGDAFKGKTGLGTYGDCIAEFDFYLGELFNTLEELGELDNTIIMFTSDNGPALEGSTAELRGGKGSAYEGGQKMPFLMRWDNNPQLFSAGSERTQSAASVDIFPTLLDLCGISYGEDNLTSHLPEDRIYDGRSMLPLIKDDTAVHTADNPILYMKNGDVHAVQYSVPVSALWEAGDDYAVTDGKEYVSFKYFPDESNDNPGFKGLSRKGYLYLLTDDGGENYNRAEVYPTVAAEMKKVLNDAAEDLKNNRRGIK
jgi:arylsulfatase A-like enzyme